MTISFDFANSVNIFPDVITANGNQPHTGALVPRAFKDAALSAVPDDEAVSGYVLFCVLVVFLEDERIFWADMFYV